MRPRRTPEFSQDHMQRPRSGRLNHAKDDPAFELPVFGVETIGYDSVMST